MLTDLPPVQIHPKDGLPAVQREAACRERRGGLQTATGHTCEGVIEAPFELFAGADNFQGHNEVHGPFMVAVILQSPCHGCSKM